MLQNMFFNLHSKKYLLFLLPDLESRNLAHFFYSCCKHSSFLGNPGWSKYRKTDTSGDHTEFNKTLAASCE